MLLLIELTAMLDKIRCLFTKQRLMKSSSKEIIWKFSVLNISWWKTVLFITFWLLKKDVFLSPSKVRMVILLSIVNWRYKQSLTLMNWKNSKRCYKLKQFQIQECNNFKWSRKTTKNDLFIYLKNYFKIITTFCI